MWFAKNENKECAGGSPQKKAMGRRSIGSGAKYQGALCLGRRAMGSLLPYILLSFGVGLSGSVSI